MPGIVVETEGEFAGWRRFDTTDTFDALIGPFYFKQMEDGSTRGAFRAQQKHMNMGGRMHGGCLMTFADIALFQIAYQEMEGMRGVTVQLDSTFVDAGRVGDLIEASGQVVRAGGSLIFARGQITCEDRTLLTFSGIIKKFRPKG
ncbi:PaaI family thioesterase [Brevundimonas sp. 2R-24]|uniref:PaaI family thioesterase n=1 Tax=Peiella sedimenti TaxID=3061083 RepID=A0ABT8SKK4_9CAUL|nr:PaaI family thioesterase [Caulobacteraceae bacterium XZ-24]